jgi:hypothetical protein
MQLRNATTFVAATASFCFVITSQIGSVTATTSLRGGGEGVEDVYILKEEKYGTFLIVSDSMFDLGTPSDISLNNPLFLAPLLTHNRA